MRFVEQERVTEYIGAIEIMSKLGELLAKIFMATKSLPKNCSLSKIAYIPFDPDFIRLIPPIYLKPPDKLQIIKEFLLEDLTTQDPDTKHNKQIVAFEEAFKKTLSNG
ncbi:hypothetical protein A2164_03610 [Candidatus Curtissbacteria bacterium RBG_13_35_7]|uniref:Uncharacterized protein n=1 Tax=Candidatus Curtissbacteria bacterium RBG_13_35_7 TaxID=1797705 RepID=A0A1F5G3P5_9BACT|nr:MAG: hypothetical protein A2164_03610 [Candidatus Curtissbacteria bacterium RBG_13_35_7]